MNYISIYHDFKDKPSEATPFNFSHSLPIPGSVYSWGDSSEGLQVCLAPSRKIPLCRGHLEVHFHFIGGFLKCGYPEIIHFLLGFPIISVIPCNLTTSWGWSKPDAHADSAIFWLGQHVGAADNMMHQPLASDHTDGSPLDKPYNVGLGIAMKVDMVGMPEGPWRIWQCDAMCL